MRGYPQRWGWQKGLSEQSHQSQNQRGTGISPSGMALRPHSKEGHAPAPRTDGCVTFRGRRRLADVMKFRILR